MTEITTAAELDALANGSLIRDAWGALGERTEDGWDFSSWRGLTSDRIALPATVLYRPDRPSDSLRSGIEALADEWEAEATCRPTPDQDCVGCNVRHAHAAKVRALLDEAGA